MRSLSPVFGLLLHCSTWTGADLRCAAPGPAGSLHPVRALMERYQAGPGCAALQAGGEETHLVALGGASGLENQVNQVNQVTVVLKPLAPPSAPPTARHRVVRLLLSSTHPVTWRLQAEDLPPRLPLQVEVSPNSSVRSAGLAATVRTLPPLPARPRALRRWAAATHGGLTSMTHSAHGNHVYIRLGQDSTQPAVCRLQSLFVSHNYIISDVQRQQVRGCARRAAPDRSGPEVHVLKLHSAGSGLCSSLQVEVVVSLRPPPGGAASRRVVLVLSSSAPVNWAVVARGVRGHVTVHSSHSVSPPHPAEPGLTLTRSLTSDLATAPDLLLWARRRGYSDVASYTEADTANRFVVRLSGGGASQKLLHPTDSAESFSTDEGRSPAAPPPPRAERRRLSGGGGERAGRESFTVNCEDGRLGVAVERRALQGFPVSAVTLSDSSCRARSNGTHFLLVFPVISCGTEGLLLRRPRGVRYSNTVLLWKGDPLDRSGAPISVRLSCFRPIPAPPGAAAPAEPEDPGNSSRVGIVNPPESRLRPEPVLVLELFGSGSYEETPVGPCVVTAERRLHVQISAAAPASRSVQVESCVVSPSPDPQKSPSWAVIRDGCSSDPSLVLEAERDRGPLRFSFVLRPVYQELLQFLHCRLQLCGSGPVQEETGTGDCRDGLRIPPLVSGSLRDQCETRNLSRPLLVSRSISPAGPRTRRLNGSAAPLVGVASTAMALGVGLMGGLWRFCTCTGRSPAQTHLRRTWSPPGQSGCSA